ncbi:MAG TPA: FtsX-like permease family protein, partial [Symbiobacteriaceae bacterium]|nr:FtsX-like permease family protein [Symbiobacteriaceae bacterium]
MPIITFMLGNLRQRKSYSVVICVLVLLAGMLLTVTVSTTQNAGRAFDRAYTQVEGPHLMYWMLETSYKPEFKAWFAAQPGVQSVRVRPQRDVKGAVLEKNGEVLRQNSEYHVLAYDPADKLRLIDSAYSKDKLLPKGEVYLPYAFQIKNGLAVGDVVDYKFGEQAMQFRVAGFLEDPIWGGELVGGKFLYLSGEDVTELERLAAGSVARNLQLRVHFQEYNAVDAHTISKRFAAESNLNAFSLFTYDQIKSWHLTLPRLSMVVMVAFVLILSLITVTILRYAILATIEADFTNIGIIKALGFTPVMVQAAITGQYALLALASGLISIGVSAFLTPVVGTIILNSTGLFFTSDLPITVGLLTVAAIVLVVSLFTFMTAGRTRQISPVRAIAQGAAPPSISPRLNVKLERLAWLPFDFRMVAKQVLTKSKRYVLLGFISALLTYTLVFLLGLLAVFGSEKAINMLGGELSDIRLEAGTKAALDQLVASIKRDYDPVWATYQTTEQLSVDGERTVVRIKDDFDGTGELTTLRGRHPKEAGEVAISDLLRASLGKELDDQLTIKDKDGNPHSFVITGVFQTIDEGGSYVRMLESGMKRLDPAYQMNMGYVKLRTHYDLDRVVSEMKAKYTGYKEISNERKRTNDTLATLKSVFSAVSMLVALLTAVIIGVITLLITKITVFAEIRELGIFKAVGFSSARIRLQLAMRFALVTLAGGVLGV